MKIDIVAVPLSGHLYPLVKLFEPLLKEPEYEIRVFTGSQKIKVVEDLGFKTFTILENKVDEFEKVANNKTKLNMFSAYKQLYKSIDLINQVSLELENEWKKDKPDIVVGDFVTPSAGLVADKLGIPWMTSMATQFAMETKSGPPCFFGGLSGDNEVINFLGNKLTTGLKKIVVSSFSNKIKHYNFKLYREDGMETIYSPYSILGIGFEEVELKKNFPPHFKWVGPILTSLENKTNYPEVKLDKNRKNVLVTCGTQLGWAKNNLIKQTKLLSDFYKDFHFYLTLGDFKNSEIDEVSRNYTILGYLPYNEYIPKFDYIIHHGGAGIFNQAISAGIPSLVLPHDYDQFDYAIRAVKAEVGYSANYKCPKEINEKFNKLINKEDWSKLEILKKRAKEYKPTELLKEELNKLMKIKK